MDKKQRSRKLVRVESNLWRDPLSKTYFVIAKVGGRLIRCSLKTTLLSVARIRRDERLRDERVGREKVQTKSRSKPLFKTYADEFLDNQRVRILQEGIKQQTFAYYEKMVKIIRRTWVGIDELDVRKITERDCKEWAKKLQLKGSQFRNPMTDKVNNKIGPTVYNNAIAVLRNIFEISVDDGVRLTNPATRLSRRKIRNKNVELPSDEIVRKLVITIKSTNAFTRQKVAELVEFLALSGRRIGEAQRITWGDINWEKETMIVKGDPKTGTKNWEVLEVPILGELFDRLKQWRENRKTEPLDSPILRVKKAYRSLESACKKLGIPKITHHTLRHVFATALVEQGMAIPDVADLLGHKDGGVLLMKTYRHKRLEGLKQRTKSVRLGFVSENASNSTGIKP